MSLIKHPRSKTDATSDDDGERGREPLAEETVFDLLGNERRRAALKELARDTDPWDVDTLSERVAEDIADSPEAAAERYDSVYISLCQVHLPKLEEVNVVRYDDDEQTVEPGARFPEIRTHLEKNDLTPDRRVDRSSATLLVSVLTVVLLGAVFLGGVSTRGVALAGVTSLEQASPRAP
jgi:hypothetical protein